MDIFQINYKILSLDTIFSLAKHLKLYFTLMRIIMNLNYESLRMNIQNIENFQIEEENIFFKSTGEIQVTL